MKKNNKNSKLKENVFFNMIFAYLRLFTHHIRSLYVRKRVCVLIQNLHSFSRCHRLLECFVRFLMFEVETERRFRFS